MKYIILFLFSVSLYSAPSGIYISASAIAQAQDNDTYVYDMGSGGSLSLGVQIDQFAMELEAKSTKTPLDGYKTSSYAYKVDGDLITDTQYLNFCYSGYNDTNLVSTVRLGVGLSNLSYEDVEISSTPLDDIELKGLVSFQASYSVGYMVSENLSYIFRYNYSYIQNDKQDEFDKEYFESQMFSLGVKYLFVLD